MSSLTDFDIPESAKILYIDLKLVQLCFRRLSESFKGFKQRQLIYSNDFEMSSIICSKQFFAILNLLRSNC